MLHGSRLGDRAGDRDNHFDLIRMIAAVAVLISHAWPLSYGRGWAEPMSTILPGFSLGHVAVLVFFAISGFFIAQSFDRTPDPIRFVRARALRLFPALVVMLLATHAAAMVLSDSPGAVWAAAPAYLARNLSLVSLQQTLPGVFTAAPFGPTVNGSLWTLMYEVICYAGLLLAGLAGLFGARSRRMAILVGVGLLAIAIPTGVDHPRVLRVLDLGWPFFLGVCLYIWRDRVVLDLRIVIAVFGATMLLRGTGVFTTLFPAALAYGVMVVGFLPRRGRAWQKPGDYSYGIYIYAFPIQQLGASLGYTTPMANIAFALPLTFVCAILSWHLVERPALSLKRGFGGSRRPLPMGAP
ncbi:acyltransferase family protein [Palleronia abyssalis]|uniref:Acyltransferase 3 domain-containing protein n=1 Tax=Palleronia abyssalis TaxID=1501240 RepID=A0A2R8BTN5_9RHOB|nr:acyltransferase [Palleronia abyssalis]SPJ23495.1 hypothetical protein PAA8504_01306 [Palleronia abyssalis]